MNKTKILLIITIILLIVTGVMAYKLYQNEAEFKTVTVNSYNKVFYELVDYMQNVETYLAKSMISASANQGAATLTHVWREANLAQSYLSMLPIESQELENTEKFLNQVSEYSYSLSRKTINNENLNDEDFKKIKEMYNYSKELSDMLNQLSTEINEGTITWNDLTKTDKLQFAQQVSSVDFTTLEENFHEYEGMIYDGAYSEHITNKEKRGLTGDDIDEEKAKQKITEFIGIDNIKDVKSNGYVENGNIPVYRFEVTTKKDEYIGISISKKGGHIVAMNNNKEISEEKITANDAIEKGKKYLESKGFNNMQETYYLKQSGFITVNYAYTQNNVIMYADLIKVKISLNDGEILGIETTGYLNNHYNRKLQEPKITIEQAREKLNKNLEISSQNLAMIPTEWETEVQCYEFKGKIDEIEFIVYINIQTGEEEDVLIVTNTPNGTLTM